MEFFNLRDSSLIGSSPVFCLWGYLIIQLRSCSLAGICSGISDAKDFRERQSSRSARCLLRTSPFQPFVLIFSLLSLSPVSRHSSSIVKYLNDFIEYIGKTHFNFVAFRLTGKIWNGRLPRVLCASDPYIESDFGETEVRKYHAAYWYALQFIFFAINWNF